MRAGLVRWVSVLVTASATLAGEPKPADGGRSDLDALRSGRLRWKLSPPLIGPARRAEDPCHAIKDPTIVHHDGRYHVFCTIRSQKRTHQIEYLSFTDFDRADAAKRHLLTVSDGYYCAPQVFFFSPHKKWYLIYQAVLEEKNGMVPAFSTTTDIADPASWSRTAAMIDHKPEGLNWIDFWVICDRERAYLFFTSLDGRMWRTTTRLADFPRGWGEPVVALKDDIFEASHTYRLRGMDRYLTIVEAQADGRRYYKAYLADALDGAWKPLAATRERPFASPVNLTGGPRWTDSISHGELIRSGSDQFLEVDPGRLRFLFQGVSDADKAGKNYGQIPWRLGLLESMAPSDDERHP